MHFYADLHIHSKYSRATSRNCDLEHLAWWAKRKGITVVGTGDFTHPAWFEEIGEKLIAAEPGLFRLRPEIEREVDRTLPGSCARPVRFMLEVEISTIYKKGEKTRKVHHLIYAPDLETAGRLREKLDRIGNLASDGRPILGLDSRHLLEITLDSGPGAYLIPAHIWTPWFAALGSKSGFDAIEECYGDLSEHIFAVETGLSSDPPMNWRVSHLDRFTLVSHSDAHSPPMLGREACVFDTEVDYFAIRRALESGEGYRGTVEFFPEEGKYHLDGHRACAVCLEPAETRRHGGKCPVCGKGLTVGVLHRVEELADRPASYRPETPMAFRSLIQLPEIVGELRGVGARSKTVERQIATLVTRLGPELEILASLPVEDVARAADPELAEALARLRRGEVRRESGYDGEYGTIRLFTPEELARAVAVPSLFELGAEAAPADGETVASSHGSPPAPPADGETVALSHGSPPAPPADGETVALSHALPSADGETVASSHALPPVSLVSRETVAPAHGTSEDVPVDSPFLVGLDPEQRRAAQTVDGPLLIVAGPGTGKTRTLTHRLAHLVGERGVPPESCLAVTFTRRAADEMRERLEDLLGPAAAGLWVLTFHALGLRILRHEADAFELSDDLQIADPEESLEIAGRLFSLSRRQSGKLLAAFSRLRRDRANATLGAGEEAPAQAWLVEKFAVYRRQLMARDRVDFDDLLALPVELLERDATRRDAWRQRFRQVSIDEYQDIDALQYSLMRLLVPAGGNLCAIGDPDQSIYSFRGAEVGFFLRFEHDEPGARRVQLRRNYRSSASIVEAALQAVAPSSLVADRELQPMLDAEPRRIVVHSSPSARAEAEFVVETIERLMGGTSSFSHDSGRVESWQEAQDLSFDDIAILYRTDAQSDIVLEALATAGLPCQKRSHQRLIDRDGVRDLLLEVRQLRRKASGERTVREWLELAAERLAGEKAEGAEHEPERVSPASGLELLLPLAERFDGDLEGFLTEVAFGAEIDAWDPRAERLSLLTLHAAKGLEFQVVFLVGCEDGLLPLRFGGEEGDLAEERRLFFVGLTRARRRLYLSHAKKRRLRGRLDDRRPSPFLRDIEKRLLEARQSRVRERRVEEEGDVRQLSLF